MTNAKNTPVILCGGSGTRLWPLSRKSLPKQFVPLIGNKNLLQLTLERLAQVNIVGTRPEVICVAAEDHRFLVAEAMQAAKVKGQIILEPVARNTAPALALAALQSAQQDLLLFCPSDHHIPDAQAFAAMVKQGNHAARQGAIVTLGVVPCSPSTAYGYIEQGAASGDGAFGLAHFIEKSNVHDAQALILQGNVLWNAGIVLAQAGALLEALQQHAGDILQSCQQAMGQVKQDQQFVRDQGNRIDGHGLAVQSQRPYLTESVPDFKQAQTEMAALRGQLALAEKEEPASSGDRDYIAKFRDFKYHDTLFELFAKQYEMARVDESREGAVIQVMDAAQASGHPKPKKALIAMVATLRTSILLLIFFFGRNALRRTAQMPMYAKKIAHMRRTFIQSLGLT